VEAKKPTREQLIELAKNDPEAIADLVLMLWDRVEKLEAKVAELERNSRTSSKPPSSDSGNFTNPPKPKSLRKKSGRKPGGQKGHKGSTLKQVPADEIDHVIEHRLSETDRCPKCSAPMRSTNGEISAQTCECRQVFELPAIRLVITEHRAEKQLCSQCGTSVRAGFPPEVNSPVQYGESIRAVAVYLNSYQLIPFQRLSEAFSVLFTCPLSAGSLVNFVKQGGVKAKQAMEPVRGSLVNVDVAHADETGCRVKGKRHWLHVLSTAWLTSFHIDPKRGLEGMDQLGLLTRYTGSLIHDFLSSYYRLTCKHFLCGAHLLRELTYLHEEMKQPWAADMIELLLDAKKLRERENFRAEGTRKVIGEKTRQRIRDRYSDIILSGLAINPEPKPVEGAAKKRGRVKRGKALNMLIRLEDRYEEIMGFFEYANIPFDNNQAERDLRMMKIREKVSGTFRSESHPEAFADIRSVTSTARKQSRDILVTIKEMFHSPRELGKSLADHSGA
jgi:transposase